MSDDGGDRGGSGWTFKKVRRTLMILTLLGGGGGIGYGAYFKLWDKHAPSWLQSTVGYGALTSPGGLKEGTTGSEGEQIRAAALGQTVQWKAVVVEVRRPLIGDPSILARHGDALVTIEFPGSADAELRGLSAGTEISFEGRLAKISSDAFVVEDAKLVK